MHARTPGGCRAGVDQVAVVVPLDVADGVGLEQRHHLVADVGVGLRDAEVEHLLVAALHGNPVARGHDPLRVRAGHVAVEVDHLGLEPDAELHAQPGDVVDQGAEAVGPHVGGDDPVPEAGVVVAAGAEPAVVQDVALDAHRRGPLCEIEQPVEVVVEVDGLPHVEGDLAVGLRVRRP